MGITNASDKRRAGPARWIVAILLGLVPAVAHAGDGDGDAAERLRQLEAQQAQIEAQEAAIAAEKARVAAELAALRESMGVAAPRDTGASDGASTVPAPTALESAAPRPSADDGDIVIVAKRFRSKIAQSTQTVSVYSRADMERLQTPLVAEIIRETPGLRPVSGGRKGGGVTAAFLRGAASIHSLVLLNGIPLNDSGSVGEFIFDGWTTTGLERVEILRGSYGLLYGSEAIGGVIWMESKRGKPGPAKAQLTLEGGSFGTHRESLSLSGGAENADYFLSLTNFGTDNDEPFAEFEARELLGRFGLDLSDDVHIDTTIYHRDTEDHDPFDAEDYAPGSPSPFTERNAYNTGRFAAIGTEATWRANDWLNVRLHGSYLGITGRYDDLADELTTYDPDGIPGNGDEFTAAVDEETGAADSREFRLRAMGSAYLNDAFGWPTADEGGVDIEFIAGAEYVDQQTRQTSTTWNARVTTAPTTDASGLREGATVKSWFVLADAGLPDVGAFTNNVINTGIRSDDTSTFGSETSPYFGARTTFEPTETSLRGSYGEGFAAPKPAVLYNPFIGNPDLQAERGKTTEFGVSQPFFDGDLVLGVTWFDLQIDDAIVYDQTPLPDRPFGSLLNSGGTTHRGFEYEGRANLGSGFTMRATASVLNNRDESTGEQIRFRKFGSAGISWQDARWLVSLDYRYSTRREEQEADAANSYFDLQTHAGRFSVFNLTGRYKVNDALTVFGRVENLTDYDYFTRHGPSTTQALGIGYYFGFSLDF